MSLYAELCAALGIGINEFLSGDDIAENDLPRRAEENILQTAADGKRRQKRLKCMVAALLIVSAAALSIIGAYLIRTNRPENVIRPVEKESTEMQTLKLLAGLDGAYMYRYTASDDFLSLRIYLTEYHFGKQVSKENWELSYRDIGSPKEGTILIVPDFENFQVKLILADGGSKLSTSFPILEGEENRKYFARAGASIEDETPITFESEQPLLALMYFAKQTKKSSGADAPKDFLLRQYHVSEKLLPVEIGRCRFRGVPRGKVRPRRCDVCLMRGRKRSRYRQCPRQRRRAYRRPRHRRRSSAFCRWSERSHRFSRHTRR